MTAMIGTLLLFSTAPMLDLPVTAWQIVPAIDGPLAVPKVTKPKAVVCIPGLYPHPLRPGKASQPEKHPWFEAKAPLLAALEPEFDVYAMGYAQTTTLDLVASAPGFEQAIAKLRKAGYTEIVLIGHSAGGLIAHQFVQRHPESGVTKVLSVAAPYAGSELADLNISLLKHQASFIRSLAPAPRQLSLQNVTPLPKEVEYCAVLCKVTRLPHDILVTTESQWPPELRKEGLPATLINANHFEILKSPQGVSVVSDLAKSKLIRWGETEVKQAAAIIYSKQADAAMIPPPKRDRPVVNKLKELLDRK